MGVGKNRMLTEADSEDCPLHFRWEQELLRIGSEIIHANILAKNQAMFYQCSENLSEAKQTNKKVMG